MGNKPVNYVSWFDAARFANWMNNGQGAGSTEMGAYDMTLATPVRLAGATVFLPSENEWYKAAYYDPINSGADAGGNADYWLYATMSDTVPTVGSASAIGDISNPGANVANYNQGAGWNGTGLGGNVTTVGSAGSISFYGAFDMAGNVAEWTEGIRGRSRDLRGGFWQGSVAFLRSHDTWGGHPLAEVDVVGFRVATIPEPTTTSLVLLHLAAFRLSRRR